MDLPLGLFDLSNIDWAAVIQSLIVLYFAISFHEASHAWMADRCGDDTARLLGRVTLNPLAHLDPIGTVLIPLVMALNATPGGFSLIGWGKPCPVNPLRFRNLRRGNLLVSLAGPGSNLLLVFAGIAVIKIYGLLTGQPVVWPVVMLDPFTQFTWIFTVLNVALFVFNLIPIPPLDGSHVLGHFLKGEAARVYAQMAQFGWILLLVLVNTPVVGWVLHGVISVANAVIGLGQTGT